MRMTKPEQFVGVAFDQLERLVRNVFIDNKNLESSHYYEKHPQTIDYVRHVQKPLAEALLDRIADVRDLCVNMAAEDEPTAEKITVARTSGNVTVRVKQRRPVEEIEEDTADVTCGWEAA